VARGAAGSVGSAEVIKDADARRDLVASWKAVRAAQGRVEMNVRYASAGGGGLSRSFLDSCHNLILIYAFAVFSDVLSQLRDEGAFKCKAWMLQKLMSASREGLPWKNFALVDEGRQRRNDAAHDFKVIPRRDCAKFIDAIEQELVAWGLLSPPRASSRQVDARIQRAVRQGRWDPPPP
jgi:hypothetical protein